MGSKNYLLVDFAGCCFAFYKRNKPGLDNLLEVPDLDELDKCGKTLKSEFYQGSNNLKKAVVAVFYKEFLGYVLTSTFALSILICDCILIFYLILYINDESKPISEGILLVTLSIITSVLGISIGVYNNLLCFFFSAKIKYALNQLVNEKSLKIHGSEIAKNDTKGKFFNVITEDMMILDTIINIVNFLAITICSIFTFCIVGVYFGIWGIVGLIVSLFHIPLILFIGNSSKDLLVRLNSVSDKRMKLIENLIEGINILKIYAWEKPYLYLISLEKEKEIALQRKIANIHSGLMSIAQTGYGLIVFISLTLKTWPGDSLVSSEVFFLLSIFVFSQGLSIIFSILGTKSIFEVLNVLKRIEILLLSQEFFADERLDPAQVSIINAEFSWTPVFPENSEVDLLNTKSSINLSNVNFEILKKGLLIVIGSLGTGKSTLVQALLGEIFILNGKYTIKGQISYSGEVPWLLQKTVKENILLGKEYEEERYLQVIKSCDLSTDFEALVNGDGSLIGDRGVTLSGGQKARVNLARALYAKADIYLLDDPLSAVDTEVGNRLFTEIKLISQEKIVILTTHQLHFIPEAEKILFLDSGAQFFFGSPQELNQQEDIKNLIGNIDLGKSKQNVMLMIKKL